MARNLADLLTEAMLRWRLNSRIRAPARPPAPPAINPPSTTPTQRSAPVTLDFLTGYRTYIIAAAMILAGIAQLVGVAIPSFDGQSAGHLLMEGLAIVFLRKGMKLAGG